MGHDGVGWYISLANKSTRRNATHWDILSCIGKAQARVYARVIRRAVANGIRESRGRAPRAEK
jgi:hypothetical protein